MKESIQTLKRKLAKYSSAKYHIEDDFIGVYPNDKDGFPVTFYDCGNEIVVSFGGWHDHFEDQEKALSCFVFGLSKQCRLEVLLRGSYEYKWTVQSLENDAWRSVDTTSLFFSPFWRSKRVKYLQNHLWDGK